MAGPPIFSLVSADPLYNLERWAVALSTNKNQKRDGERWLALLEATDPDEIGLNKATAAVAAEYQVGLHLRAVSTNVILLACQGMGLLTSSTGVKVYSLYQYLSGCMPLRTFRVAVHNPVHSQVFGERGALRSASITVMYGAQEIDETLAEAGLVHNDICEEWMLVRTVKGQRPQLLLGCFKHSSWHVSIVNRLPTIMDSSSAVVSHLASWITHPAPEQQTPFAPRAYMGDEVKLAGNSALQPLCALVSPATNTWQLGMTEAKVLTNVDIPLAEYDAAVQAGSFRRLRRLLGGVANPGYLYLLSLKLQQQPANRPTPKEQKAHYAFGQRDYGRIRDFFEGLKQQCDDEAAGPGGKLRLKLEALCNPLLERYTHGLLTLGGDPVELGRNGALGRSRLYKDPFTCMQPVGRFNFKKVQDVIVALRNLTSHPTEKQRREQRGNKEGGKLDYLKHCGRLPRDGDDRQNLLTLLNGYLGELLARMHHAVLAIKPRGGNLHTYYEPVEPADRAMSVSVQQEGGFASRLAAWSVVEVVAASAVSVEPAVASPAVSSSDPGDEEPAAGAVTSSNQAAAVAAVAAAVAAAAAANKGGSSSGSGSPLAAPQAVGSAAGADSADVPAGQPGFIMQLLALGDPCSPQQQVPTGLVSPAGVFQPAEAVDLQDTATKPDTAAAVHEGAAVKDQAAATPQQQQQQQQELQRQQQELQQQQEHLHVLQELAWLQQHSPAVPSLGAGSSSAAAVAAAGGGSAEEQEWEEGGLDAQALMMAELQRMDAAVLTEPAEPMDDHAADDGGGDDDEAAGECAPVRGVHPGMAEHKQLARSGNRMLLRGGLHPLSWEQAMWVLRTYLEDIISATKLVLAAPARLDITAGRLRGLTQDTMLNGFFGPEVIELFMHAVRSYLVEGSCKEEIPVLLGYLLRLYPNLLVPGGQHAAELLLHCCCMELVPPASRCFSSIKEQQCRRAKELLRAARNGNPELLVDDDVEAVATIVQAAQKHDALTLLQVAASCSSGLLHLWLSCLDSVDVRQTAMRQLRDSSAVLTVQHSAVQLGMCQREAVGQVSCGPHSIAVEAAFAKSAHPENAAAPLAKEIVETRELLPMSPANKKGRRATPPAAAAAAAGKTAEGPAKALGPDDTLHWTNVARWAMEEDVQAGAA